MSEESDLDIEKRCVTFESEGHRRQNKNQLIISFKFKEFICNDEVIFDINIFNI